MRRLTVYWYFTWNIWTWEFSHRVFATRTRWSLDFGPFAVDVYWSHG